MRWAWLILAASCAGAERPAEEGPGPAAAPPVLAAEADRRAETIELGFAGDVMFGRFVASGFREIPAEKHDPFAHVAELLDSDFTMVNLETPILRDAPTRSPYGHKMRFVTTPARVASLARANIDAVTLANNHAFDMKGDGLRETPAILDELGLRHIGAHDPDRPVLRAETIEVAGWKIAFIPATTERNWAEKRGDVLVPATSRAELLRSLRPVVAAARRGHHLVIVVLHWGDEYQDAPAPWQVDAARAFVDAGADAVIAHHPHVLQGIERHGDGLIAYSLGNFVFDNLHGVKRLHGILKLTFRRDGERGCLDHGAYHPTVGTRPRFTPRPAGKEFDKVADRLRTLSRQDPLHPTEWTVDDERDRLLVAGSCSAQE